LLSPGPRGNRWKKNRENSLLAVFWGGRGRSFLRKVEKRKMALDGTLEMVEKQEISKTIEETRQGGPSAWQRHFLMRGTLEKGNTQGGASFNKK